VRVLVTGGAGYIGSVVVAELVCAGHSVVAYDNLSQGHRAAVHRDAELVVGDLADRSALDDLFRRNRLEAAMHFAAFAEVAESMQEPERYFRNNVSNSLNLLEAMQQHQVNRLVFSSSGAVYGEPRRVPIEENESACPVNPYGESKLAVERMLEWLHRIRGLRFASLRYFNAAGATEQLGEDHHPESHLIPRLLRAAADQGDPVTIQGTDYPTPDGTCIRDYVHVADLATAHRMALEALDDRGRVLCNLGTGRGFSIREVVESARRVTGRSISIVQGPRRPGDPSALVASCAKAERELGWKARYCELDAIVASAWEWHCRRPQGYPE
jgi:UDP-glucose 4-epimerase